MLAILSNKLLVAFCSINDFRPITLFYCSFFIAILSKQHYLLYCLVPAIQPRMLITFVCDEDRDMELKQVNVPVRVGQVNRFTSCF